MLSNDLPTPKESYSNTRNAFCGDAKERNYNDVYGWTNFCFCFVFKHHMLRWSLMHLKSFNEKNDDELFFSSHLPPFFSLGGWCGKFRKLFPQIMNGRLERIGLIGGDCGMLLRGPLAGWENTSKTFSSTIISFILLSDAFRSKSVEPLAKCKTFKSMQNC